MLNVPRLDVMTKAMTAKLSKINDVTGMRRLRLVDAASCR